MIQKILTFSAAILLVISCGALVGFAHEAEETATYADLEVDVQEIDGMVAFSQFSDGIYLGSVGIKGVVWAKDAVDLMEEISPCCCAFCW